MELKDRTPFAPQLDLQVNNWWLVRIDGIELIDHKGRSFSVLKLSVFDSGSGGLPNSTLIDSALSLLPTNYQAVAGSAFEKTVFADGAEKAKDTIWIFQYLGKIDIGGGQTFNQWRTVEVVLTDAEKSQLVALPA